MPARSARSACSALHGPRIAWPPWTHPSMARMDLCLHGPMAPGAMAPNVSMLRLRRPTPYSQSNDFKGPQCMPARSARSVCSAPGPMPPWPHGLDPHGLHGPMPPWPYGAWRHGPQCVHASTANPSWPHGPMVPWPYASRPNQMTNGPSARPPAPPAPLAPPFPRSTRPPWPSTPMAPMDPCLQGLLRRPTPTLWLLAPWPHGPLTLCLCTQSNDFKGPQCMPARSARSACSALPPLHRPSMAFDHGPGAMASNVSMLRRPISILWVLAPWPHGPLALCL